MCKLSRRNIRMRKKGDSEFSIVVVPHHSCATIRSSALQVSFYQFDSESRIQKLLIFNKFKLIEKMKSRVKCGLSEIVFGSFVLVLICASVAADCRLRPVESSCDHSTQCQSSYCRGGRCVYFHQVSDEEGRSDPCLQMNACPPGQKCSHREVQCIMYPCPSLMECGPDECH